MRSEEDLTLAIAAVLERHQRTKPLAKVTGCTGGTINCRPNNMSAEGFLWHQARAIVDEELVKDYAVLKAKMEAALIEAERAKITSVQTAQDVARRLPIQAPIVPPAFWGEPSRQQKDDDFRSSLGCLFLTVVAVGFIILFFIAAG
jgi:hypothetical protein